MFQLRLNPRSTQEQVKKLKQLATALSSAKLQQSSSHIGGLSLKERHDESEATAETRIAAMAPDVGSY